MTGERNAQVTTQVEERTVQDIPVAKTDVHRLNPRKELGDLTELAESIRQQGVLIPILVVRDNGGFAAVHGSRRLAAAKLAGLTEIPAIVRDSMPDNEVAEIALVENLQREDLGPLEVAEGYKTYLAEVKGSTVASLAERLGKPVSTIRNTLRLLKAPEHVKRELKNGNLTAAHVKVILSLADPSLIDKLDLWDLSVEQLHADVDAMNSEYRLQGPEAAATAKKFLEDMKLKFPNATLTWYERGGAVVMEQLLGKPPTKIVDRDSVLHAEKTHDKLCGCLAYAVSAEVVRAARGRGVVETLTFKAERVCIDVKGAKKVDAERNARTRAAKPSATAPARLPKQTAAQREKARKRKEQEAITAAERVLNGKARYEHLNVKIDPKLVKGKLDGELARLALFTIAAVNSSEYAEGWRPQLWRKIAKLKIADVRKRTAEWVARAALREIGSRQDEKLELQQLVLGHYGVEVKVPAKKAKKAK